MAKWVADVVLDEALDYIKQNATEMIACSTQPTNFLQATSTYALADVVVASGNFTIANGTSGRKVTVAATSGITVDSSGTFAHVALCTAATLLYVTTGTSQVLTAGNTVDFPAWAIQLSDPA